VLHEDDILIEARVQRVQNGKDVLRGCADSCKSDDDDRPPIFRGKQGNSTRNVISIDGALIEFSATLTVPFPQHWPDIQAKVRICIAVAPEEGEAKITERNCLYGPEICTNEGPARTQRCEAICRLWADRTRTI
jgi:hypothetical protein